jgi:hypothetical protein
MRVLEPRSRPQSFKEGLAGCNHRWTIPFFAVDWTCEWIAYYLSHWNFLEVLEYLSSLSVLVAVVFYFSETGDRVKQRHYQAWQVINTAQGKGGSGGRIEALQELNADRVPLVGVDASGAFLQGVQLPGAKLVRANFSAADMRNSDLARADLSDANLQSTNLRSSTLRRVILNGVDLSGSDLTGADLSSARLDGVNLDNADLRRVNLAGVEWRGIRSLKGANIHGVTNAPDGFVSWALKRGAVDSASDDSQ